MSTGGSTTTSNAEDTDNIQSRNDHLRSLRFINPLSLAFTPIPKGTAICRIHALRCGHLDVPARDLIQDVLDDVTLPLPAYAFLIEKLSPEDGSVLKRVLFDLGLRKSYGNHRYQFLTEKYQIHLSEEEEIASILRNSLNISPSSIDAVILGHRHFDHIGDLGAFPVSVDLVLGPDSEKDLVKLADYLDLPLQVLQSRNIRHLERNKDEWKEIGAFKGHDYFGDGSLFILDAPGHCAGHQNVLVRTSGNPPIYHLLASDTTHHIILAREPKQPSLRRPLISIFPEDPNKPSNLLSFHDDLEEAYRTIAKAERMDLEENVNVFLAHDISLDRLLRGGIGSAQGGVQAKNWFTLDGNAAELKRFKDREWEDLYLASAYQS
ncbi:beta-lactamase-like protein [Cantharellus anzutake]|uniref:beta-lactamase-like protein n=1 Tax=Cantharellus anzutake TaxID=1750568 RepID=UPI0019039D34|nr:beta-lactamase-like protein [Cantharellus anzutake]KAF8333137.1 beta-lactamase-like protein [Cantharellus anzutake]